MLISDGIDTKGYSLILELLWNSAPYFDDWVYYLEYKANSGFKIHNLPLIIDAEGDDCTVRVELKEDFNRFTTFYDDGFYIAFDTDNADPNEYSLYVYLSDGIS